MEESEIWYLNDKTYAVEYRLEGLYRVLLSLGAVRMFSRSFLATLSQDFDNIEWSTHKDYLFYKLRKKEIRFRFYSFDVMAFLSHEFGFCGLH